MSAGGSEAKRTFPARYASVIGIFSLLVMIIVEPEIWTEFGTRCSRGSRKAESETLMCELQTNRTDHSLSDPPITCRWAQCLPRPLGDCAGTKRGRQESAAGMQATPLARQMSENASAVRDPESPMFQNHYPAYISTEMRDKTANCLRVTPQ